MRVEPNSTYFEPDTVSIPSLPKKVLSRILMAPLTGISREQALRLGLTPVDDERAIIALKHARGRVLDVGCGANNFVRTYGNGIGVDVEPWAGIDQVIEDAAELPFEDESFDTVTYLASLNHIPNREEALREGFRVCKSGGQLLATMLSPRMGQFIHWLRKPHDPDQQDREIDHSEELLGIDPREMRRMIEAAGFREVRRKRFMIVINNLLIAERP
jgi:SAM-dependent methyltransferase